MRSTTRGVVFAGVLAAVVAADAGAQMPVTGAGASLGGYGGSLTDAGPGMGGGGGAAIPFAGRFGGFMPYRMGGGGGGGLSFSAPTRGAAPAAAGRAPFGLTPMSGGMGGQGLGAGSRVPSVRGMAPMSGSRGPGVMPPSFGYPFRQPPSLVAPSSGSGMSM